MKKIKNFIGHTKIFFGISITLFVIGIVCNIIFGTQMDIQFTGGAIIEYSYTGQVNEEQLKTFLQNETTDKVSFTISKNLIAGTQMPTRTKAT